MGERVRIAEVGPRDGLQNESGQIPSSEKVRLVRLLVETGVDEVEVSSFVSPKWVPQLGDAAAVFDALAGAGVGLGAEVGVGGGEGEGGVGDGAGGVMLSALVPNEKGLEGALAVNERAGRRLIGKVSVFTAASETFSKRNTNAGIAETIDRFGGVVSGAHERGLLVRGYVSCAIACPFEGAIDPGAVARVSEMLAGIGVDEIDLGDTIGHGTAETTAAMVRAVVGALGDGWLGRLTLHLHDTFMRATECVVAGLDLGVRSFDGSVAGLGGCPFASTPERRAPGNIATETLVRCVESRGFVTGVDKRALSDAAGFARSIVLASRGGARSDANDGSGSVRL